jgi:SAM-dependent methyltransferase
MDPVALAARLPDASAFERHVLDALDVPCEASFFAWKGERPTTRGLDARRLDRALRAGAYEHELAPLKRAAQAGRGVVVDTAILGEHGARGCAYHRDFAAERGGRHSLIAFLSLRGQPVGALMLGRTVTSFGEREIARIEQLSADLAVARASYGSPFRGPPLPACPASALDRLRALATGSRVLSRGAITVRDRGGWREMIADSLVWTRASLSDPARSGWFYVDLMQLAALRARRILVVGCGGGVVVRALAEALPGASIDVVDPDPEVLALARAFFGLDSLPGVRLHQADGAAMIARADAREWDAILVDAFDGSALAEPFAQPAFFHAARRALAKAGALSFNVIGTLALGDEIRRVEASARAAFGEVRLVPVIDPDEAIAIENRRNVVVIARD